MVKSIIDAELDTLRYPLNPEDTFEITPERREYMIKLNKLAKDANHSLPPPVMVVIYRSMSIQTLRTIFPSRQEYLSFPLSGEYLK
jgi:hypothetical protein